MDNLAPKQRREGRTPPFDTTLLNKKTMKDKDILQKAIEMAFENGWRDKYENLKPYDEHTCNLLVETNRYMTFLFSHDFAKTFFTNCTPLEILKIKRETDLLIDVNIQFWQYHLQKMVLEENPIKYLEQFINTELSVFKPIIFDKSGELKTKDKEIINILKTFHDSRSGRTYSFKPMKEFNEDEDQKKSWIRHNLKTIIFNPLKHKDEQ